MGTVTQRGHSFTARVRLKGVERTKTFRSRTMAKAWLAEIEGQIQRSVDGLRVDVSAKSLDQLITEYVKEVKPYSKWGRSKDAALDKLQREIGHVYLSNLTKTAIVDYAKARHKEGAKAATVAPEISYLGAVLKFGASHRDYDVNLEAYRDARMILKDLRLIGRSAQRKRVIRDAELQRIGEAFNANKRMSVPMGDITLFAMETAMRMSEILNLRWADYNADDRTILIRDRKHPLEKLGNDQEVPLLGDAVAILERQPRRTEWVFPYTGLATTANFTRTCQRLGIEDLHFHDLRHSALSALRKRGYDIPELQLISGHKNVNMLMRYTHVKAIDLHRD